MSELRERIAEVLMNVFQANPALVQVYQPGAVGGADVDVTLDCLPLADALISALDLTEDAGVIVGCAHE